MRSALLGAVLLALCTACQRSREPDLPGLERGLPDPPYAPHWVPPADWDTMPVYDFEAMVGRELPEDVLTPIPRPELDEVVAALDRMDHVSVRAAVILARARTELAGRHLLARLQKREVGPERHSDAADVLGAAALARFPHPERYWRLVRLVEAPNPHPDLEVRVECAVSALRMGIDRVIPFLLQVLRIGTWEGQADELDFEPTDTTAWARGRAAEALSHRAGVPVTYQTDAPIAAREREARRLADLLADVIANAPEIDYRKM
jgi:hypothetical protein